MKQQTIKVPGIEAEQIITNGGKISNQQIIHITGNGITEHITMPESGQLIIITQQLPLPESGMSLYHCNSFHSDPAVCNTYMQI